MTNALCLKCDNYKLEWFMIEHGAISHPTMLWGCIKYMEPIDGICLEYIPRRPDRPKTKQNSPP